MMENFIDDSKSDSSSSADSSSSSDLKIGNTQTTKETPIEREIRHSIEREKSLRRSRGLPNPIASIQYVEIPSQKNVFHQTTFNSEQFQGKERLFAGKKMQHEIHEETKRELDLVKLGKVPGYYDKGTVRQLKEKKQIFEAFQAPSDLASLTISGPSKTMTWTSSSDDSSSQTSSSDSSDSRESIEQITLFKAPNNAKMPSASHRGLGYSESTSRVIIMENNMTVPKKKTLHTYTVDSGTIHVSKTRDLGQVRHKEWENKKAFEEIVPKENPFFKLRPSTNGIKVEQDIRETQERERELYRQRISLYGSTLNGQTYVDFNVPLSKKRNPAVPKSVGKIGVWPPAQPAEAKMTQTTRHDPTPYRQKSPLVERWESGLVFRHSEDEN